MTGAEEQGKGEVPEVPDRPPDGAPAPRDTSAPVCGVCSQPADPAEGFTVLVLDMPGQPVPALFGFHDRCRERARAAFTMMGMDVELLNGVSH